jgi:hypothetical protein
MDFRWAFETGEENNRRATNKKTTRDERQVEEEMNDI